MLSVAGSAVASQIVPTHETTETKQIHDAVSSVHVVADVGAITVRPGSATSVSAHEEWNFQQPKLQVSVSSGRLDVSITCGDGTQVGPADLALLNDCTDDLTLTIPAEADLVASSGDGNVTTAGMRATQHLTSDVGKVAVSNAVGALVASTSDGEITATDVDAPNVLLRSDRGDVVASSVIGDLTASSSDGVVSLTRVRAGTIAAHSDTNDVSVSNSRATRVVAGTSSGRLRVIGVRAEAFALTNDTGSVLLHTVNAPRNISARTSDGAVAVEVPAGRYAVDAHSTDGQVHVSGLTRSAAAARHITARSDTGNVRVTGF